MNDSGSPPPRGATLGKAVRRAIRLDDDALVQSTALDDHAFPRLMTPTVAGVQLPVWAASHRSLIDRSLLEYGALLFRGFVPMDMAQFRTFAEQTSVGGLIDYTYRSTPRTKLTDAIYTSTEYPADQFIPFHNEMSYAHRWPRKIWFCCLVPSATGGATPLADSRRVYARLPDAVRAAFRSGVMYVRNYGGPLDLPLENVFGTADRDAIDRYCAEAGIETEWRSRTHLRTRQRCQAIAQHPQTHEPTWFNQAHLFHISSLDPAVAAQLLAEYDADDLPRHAYHGDGSAIDPAMLDIIRDAYRQESSSRWPKPTRPTTRRCVPDHFRIAFLIHDTTGGRPCWSSASTAA
jgi:alpha-ketoglutarate-dependent taurine dioxygenase